MTWGTELGGYRMCVCLHVCTAPCVCQKNGSEWVRSLELELQEVLSLLVGAGNQALECLREQQVILLAELSLQPWYTEQVKGLLALGQQATVFHPLPIPPCHSMLNYTPD